MKLFSRRAPAFVTLAVLPLTIGVTGALVQDAQVATAATAAAPTMAPAITITN